MYIYSNFAFNFFTWKSILGIFIVFFITLVRDLIYGLLHTSTKLGVYRFRNITIQTLVAVETNHSTLKNNF